MSKRRRVASASSTRRRVASASSTRRRAASPSPGTHSRYSCGTDSSAEPEPMGDLGPFTSGGPTTALVDDALLGDAVTEDRRSCSSCGPSCKARIFLTVPVHGIFGAAAGLLLLLQAGCLLLAGLPLHVPGAWRPPCQQGQRLVQGSQALAMTAAAATRAPVLRAPVWVPQ